MARPLYATLRPCRVLSCADSYIHTIIGARQNTAAIVGHQVHDMYIIVSDEQTFGICIPGRVYVEHMLTCARRRL